MWEINTTDQVFSFLLSAILGILLCIIYDFFRAIRKAVSFKTASVFIQDIVYFSIAGILTFCLFLITTHGQIRGFVFIGIVLGFALCRITVSVIFFKVLVFIIIKVLALVRKIKHKIKAIFTYFSKKFKSCAEKTLKFIKNMIFIVKNSCIKIHR